MAHIPPVRIVRSLAAATVALAGIIPAAPAAAAEPPEKPARHETGMITVQPAPDNAMLLNPGKGYVQYWEPDVKIFYKYREPDDKYVRDYIGIGYSRFNWSALEPKEGVFDWSIPDRFIAEYARYGKKVGFGVMSVTTGQREQYVTPKWVFDAGAVPLTISDESTPSGTQVIPMSWADPVFLAKMQAFIAAFGKHYDGNPNIAFIDIRAYGNWGEGHIGALNAADPSQQSKIVLTPPDNLQNNYYLPYLKAFPHTLLIAVWGSTLYDKVYDWGIPNGIGIRRDGILSQWSKDGSECLRAHGHVPAVFEYCDTYDNTKRDGYWGTDLLWKYVMAGKPTYMHWERKIFEENKEFCLKLGNKVGYHFVLQEAEFPAAIRPGMDMMIETHAMLNTQLALEMAERLSPLGVTWYEEPVGPENANTLRAIRERIKPGVPICVGERHYTRHGFRPVLEQHLCDVIMPDITRCGGPSEMKRIATMAEAYGVPIAPHNPNGPLSTLASAHVCASIPNFFRCEFMFNDVPWRDKVITHPFDVRDGHFHLSDRPGLGVDLVEDEMEKYPGIRDLHARENYYV